MNKKEKEILEKRVLESELECLEAEEDMKSDKSKQARMLAMEKRMAAKMKDKKTKESRFVAHAAKFAAEEAAYICRNFGLDVEGIRAKAQETFEFEKG